MSVKGFLTRTLCTVVVTTVLVGTVAGLSTLPAHAAPAPQAINAVHAASMPHINFSAVCGPGRAYAKMSFHANALAGFTYAYRVAAYDWTNDGWQWKGSIADFQYDTIRNESTRVVGGELSYNLPTSHVWHILAEVWVWDGTKWFFMNWTRADHSGMYLTHSRDWCAT